MWFVRVKGTSGHACFNHLNLLAGNIEKHEMGFVFVALDGTSSRPFPTLDTCKDYVRAANFESQQTEQGIGAIIKKES